MDPAVARVLSSPSTAFEDGFGPRHVTTGADGDTLEILTFREELTSVEKFEPAVRDRCARLAEFRSEHFARVRSVEKIGRGGGQLALVSDYIPGARLSHVLSVAESRLLPIEINAALCVIRQLVHAIAVLHDKAPELCHGAIGPERLIVTPQSRLVIVEHVLGSAVEQLRYSNKQYWEQLRVPLPRTFGAPHFDRRADVTQVGATALALVVGRPLADDEFPAHVAEMTSSALALSSTGGLEPLPLPLRVWLQRALQIDSRTPFGSALEAWAELDRVLNYSDPIAEMESLKQFMARYYAAVAGQTMPSAIAPPAPAPVQAPPPAPAARVTPFPSTSAEPPQSAPAATSPALSTTMPTQPPPHTPPPQPAAPSVPSMSPSAASNSGFWDSPGSPRAGDPTPSYRPPGQEAARQAVRANRHSWLRLGAAAALLIALTAGLTLAARQFLSEPVAADGMGTLVVQTNPSGAAVEIDGERRGVTPLSLDLPPGRHTLKLTTDDNVRSMPITITAGSQVSQFIEMPRASSVLGELRVRTDPPGAQVTVDGHAYGKSPLTVEGLAPGVHTVLLENEIGSITQEVKIEAGTTASLVVPLTAPSNAPVSGWIAVNAPIALEVYEDSRLIGTSQSDRIMVSVGRHRLQLVNEALGYSDTQVVNVAPGKVSSIRPALPKGIMSFNAVPWASVFVDGQQVGETPLGNVSVPIGTHEVVFRHPDLGEKRVRSVVTLGAPAKVSVDMRQR